MGMFTSSFAQDAADAARRAAEEAARRERERKRKKLQAEIDRWNAKLSEVRSLVLRLEKEMHYLGRKMDEWAAYKNRCKGNLLLSEVAIINRFEGTSADTIKENFTSCVGEMNNTYLRTDRLRDDGNAQIQRLNQYISFINDKIMSLTRELNAI